MPSQRRVRVFTILAALFLIVLYYTNRSSQQSDRTFYDKTVQALKAKDAAKTPADIPKPNIPSPEDKRNLQEAAEKSRIQGILEEQKVREEAVKKAGKPAAAATSQRTLAASPMPGAARKWDTGDEPATPPKEKKTEEELDVEAELNAILKRSPIIIFSKTYCPHSKRAKAVFEKYTITPSPFIVELDVHKMGPQLQDQLHKITGRRTVPNVLISGTSIGGGDDVAGLDEHGALIDKIKTLGGKRIMEIALKKT